MKTNHYILVAALTCVMSACDTDTGLSLPSRESPSAESDGFTLIARIVHISDTHVVDEESPARFAGAQEIISSAGRPFEAYSAQLVDGVIRAANRIHASDRAVDFLIHTGDATDNCQSNEAAWLLDLFEGGALDPLTGPDDRPIDARPDPLLDPHAAFTAQGLYQMGAHGDLPSIPWYIVFGNHDRFGLGVFAIFEDLWGHRTAPLPFPRRPGILMPAVFDPVAWLAHGNVTPADPGPPSLLDLPCFVQPNPERAYFNKREFIRGLFTTLTIPSGHGFADPETGPSWYSVAPVPGLRLIGLDTCEPAHQIAGFPYQAGSVSAGQVDYLIGELEAARANDEIVIVASHHPSGSLTETYGSALLPDAFRSLLQAYPNVALHLAGHTHRNRVTDRETYIEIETCSTLDLPQEGRIIEIRRNNTDGSIAIAYEMFSHLDDELPPLGDDPLLAMRQVAGTMALGDTGAAERQKLRDPSGSDPRGKPDDRDGTIILGPDP